MNDEIAIGREERRCLQMVLASCDLALRGFTHERGRKCWINVDRSRSDRVHAREEAIVGAAGTVTRPPNRFSIVRVLA